MNSAPQLLVRTCPWPTKLSLFMAMKRVAKVDNPTFSDLEDVMYQIEPEFRIEGKWASIEWCLCVLYRILDWAHLVSSTDNVVFEESLIDTNIGLAIHRACDAAGIPRWSPNRLRKTAGTKIRRETGSLEVAQAVLGHKSRSTTERFYAEIDVTLAADIMKKIG